MSNTEAFSLGMLTMFIIVVIILAMVQWSNNSPVHREETWTPGQPYHPRGPLTPGAIPIPPVPASQPETHRAQAETPIYKIPYVGIDMIRCRRCGANYNYATWMCPLTDCEYRV